MDEKLFRILADTFGLNPSEIREDASVENTPGWDSVAHLNLVLSLEGEFGLRFSPEEFMQMQSVPAIRAALARHGRP